MKKKIILSDSVIKLCLITIFSQNSCSAAKFAFNHEGTVNYNQQIPKLDQFSICLWMRFTKHDGDHVMFTYSGKFPLGYSLNFHFILGQNEIFVKLLKD